MQDREARYQQWLLLVFQLFVNPNESLLNFLWSAETGSSKSESYTMQQIFEIIRDYVRTHRLYDLQDPAIVHCGSDPLGKVFGVDCFTVRDVLNLVNKNSQLKSVLPISFSLEPLDNVSSTSDLKRKWSSDVEVESSTYSKKILLDEGQVQLPDMRWDLLSVANGAEVDSDIETVYSIQSKITDVVKDSTDDLWFLDTDDSDDDIFGVQSDSDVYANEYELISERGDTGDRSDDDEITVHSSQQEIIVICESESDLDFFADCEDFDLESDGPSDEDLNDGDKWTCLSCQTVNYPLRRFCDCCWTLRPDWLSLNGPATDRRPTGNHFPSESGGLVIAPTSSSASDIIQRGEPDVLLSNQAVESLYGGADRVDGCSQASIGESSDGDVSGGRAVLLSSSGQSQPVGGLCVVCLAKPKDASIVHGSTGHQACCFQCAQRLKRRSQPCPVCRRPIHRVIRNYFV